MEQVPKYQDYLSVQRDPAFVDDHKGELGSRPTRAWVRPDEAQDENPVPPDRFRCLVEAHPGDHWDRRGGLVEGLRWALDDHAAEEFYLWNDECADWDRPSQDEVRLIILGT
jgi:hypothetical protein